MVESSWGGRGGCWGEVRGAGGVGGGGFSRDHDFFALLESGVGE